MTVDVGENTWTLTVMPVGGFEPEWVRGATAGAVLASAAVSLLLGFGLWRAARRKEEGRDRGADDDEEETRRLQRSVDSMRDLLGIRPSDGFLVGPERAPAAWRLFQRGRAVAVRARDLEALGWLSMWEEFDVRCFDSLCASLQGDADLPLSAPGSPLEMGIRRHSGLIVQSWTRPPSLMAYLRLRQWLLELSCQLLDPESACPHVAVPAGSLAPASPPARPAALSSVVVDSMQSRRPDKPSGASGGSWRGFMSGRWRIAAGEEARCGAACRCRRRQKERFEYFRSFVGQVWLQWL